jgi:hypothetical protein
MNRFVPENDHGAGEASYPYGHLRCDAEDGFAATNTKTSARSSDVAESASHRTFRELPANGAKSDDAMALSMLGKAEPCSKTPGRENNCGKY